MTFLQVVGRKCGAVRDRSAAQSPGRESGSRPTGVGGAAVFLLVVGTAASTAAAAASLLVESVPVKRALWVAVLLAVSVSAGLWRSGQSVTGSPPDSDRLSHVPRAGSPR